MTRFVDHRRLRAVLCTPVGGRLLAGLLLVLLVLGTGCASNRPYTLDPVKTRDPDDRPVAMPRSSEQNEYWDRLDLSLFYQLEKPLDFSWTGRQVGQMLGVAGEKQAENVNALDEPPNSSWYTRRHFYRHMTPDALARGASEDAHSGPDTSGIWRITDGKNEGSADGFFIEDARGDRYLIKLDKPDYNGLASSAEVIATNILHASGYYVPENTIVYFHPKQLTIAPGATIRTSGARTQSMRRSDLARMLAPRKRTPGGKIRAMASRIVDGEVLGPWDFRGIREDDPNDRVRHEDRRELRGLRVISSWINDTDRRAANTLAVYTEQRYVKHYLLDMSSTLGANTGKPHRPIQGQAYVIDPRYMARALAGLGLYEFPWWQVDTQIRYPSVGYFRADVFEPGRWVPGYPNPAFERMTLRDAFWGAKIVMSFRDEDVRALVESARMDNPAAEAYLLDVLLQRRDKIGRYWFARINPLDRFRIVSPAAGPIAARNGFRPRFVRELRFEDLAVSGNLEPASTSAYVYTVRHQGETLVEETATERPIIPLATSPGEHVEEYLARRGAVEDDDRVVGVEIRTRRGDDALSKYVRVYIHFPADRAPPRIVGLQREE